VSIPEHIASSITQEAVGKTVVLHNASLPIDLLPYYVAYIQWGSPYLQRNIFNDA